MENISGIIDALDALRDETSGENRPTVNKEIIEKLIQEYDNIKQINLDYSEQNRRNILSFIHSISYLKQDYELTGLSEKIARRLQVLMSMSTFSHKS